MSPTNEEPASGELVVGEPEMREQAAEARSLSGPMGTAGVPVDRSTNFRATARRLLRQLGPELVPAVAVVVLALVSVVPFMLGPRVLGDATNVIFDGYFGPTHRIDFGKLHWILAQSALLCLASVTFLWAQQWILNGVVHRTMSRLRRDAEEKLHRLPLAYVDQTPRGDLLSRITNDLDNLAQALQQATSQLLTSLLQLVGTAVMLLVISWQLALVVLVSFPALLGVLRFVGSRSGRRFAAQWRHTGELNSLVEEAITGHAIVKVFGQQAQVEARFDEENARLYEASFGAQVLSGTVQPATMFLGNLTYVGIAVLGGLRVANGSLSIGDVQAIIQYSRQFSQPMTYVASMFNLMQSGLASAERVFEFLDGPEELDDSHLGAAAHEPRGRVAFEHVSFSYRPERPLIEDLSFVAEPGQTVAIVGPTGAGKTTLVNLLMRFYDLGAGRITLDGVDIAEMRRADVRAHIGMVLQDTWLFGGTIRDNIAYGKPEASEDEIRAAATVAYVDRFVHSLPDGYATVLDDEGSSVSAGEKQLITIARAFLADPTILVLDEATSSVDTRTEVLVQAAMAELRSTRTAFVIAHRLSTIRDADTILVMEHGRIAEHGGHDELLLAGGAYYDLYNAQFAAPALELDVGVTEGDGGSTP